MARPQEKPQREKITALGKLFCRRLKELRAERGLNQIDFAKKAGLTQQFVSKLESGRAEPSLGTLEKLAKCLRVEINDLLTAPKKR